MGEEEIPEGEGPHFVFTGSLPLLFIQPQRSLKLNSDDWWRDARTHTGTNRPLKRLKG